jgi:hypothetical protein
MGLLPSLQGDIGEMRVVMPTRDRLERQGTFRAGAEEDETGPNVQLFGRLFCCDPLCVLTVAEWHF